MIGNYFSERLFLKKLLFLKVLCFQLLQSDDLLLFFVSMQQNSRSFLGFGQLEGKYKQFDFITLEILRDILDLFFFVSLGICGQNKQKRKHYKCSLTRFVFKIDFVK